MTGQSGRRILIVDDDAQMRKIIAHRVRSLGYAADVASSVEHARALAKAHSYDVVLTDLLLPGANGTRWS